MNIKTDFGIGDEVWFIDGDNGYPHLYKGKVTNITITSENGRPVVKYTLDGDDENEDSALKLAWEMLTSLAGYCPCRLFDKWFEGKDAEKF